MSDVDVRTTVHIERCLARLETQDATVRSGLLKYARRRLELLADRMFARFPMLHPQEKAENVFQEAMLRLWRSLEEAGPATVADFMGRAALQMRRALVDLSRTHFSQNRDHANGSRIVSANSVDSLKPHPAETNGSPDELACWSEFHEAAGRLVEPQRTAFDLLYYHELPQAEVAELMQVSERQVRRYWQTARRELQGVIEGMSSGSFNDQRAPVRASDDRLAELLLRWEESIADGTPLETADLCRDCPELLADLEREIGRLRTIDRFIFPETGGTSREHPPARDVAAKPGRFPSLPGYEIVEELGRGGMGVVYKARQQSLGRLVALKTLAGSRWGQPGFVARLWKEAQALSRINHPNVVQVIDVVESDNAVSIVLEYIDGQSLARKQNGVPMAASEAARLSLILAQTMAAVHEQGILHRDIKPANVLISDAGEIRISDFGLAKETASTGGLTVTGELLGSPGYMAPEQAEGRVGQIDARTDIYALGATLYEMLTGRPPFVGGSMVETLDQVRECEPVSPRLLNPQVPRDLETICLKCLEKSQSQRFATAGALGDELQRFLSGEPIHARPIGTLARAWRWCRRKPAKAGAVALLVVAAAAIVDLTAVNYRNLAHYNQDLTRLNNDLTRLNSDLNTTAATARSMQALAEERERQTRESLYVANISRAAAAEREGDTRTMLQLLEEFIPAAGEPDLRGFEWWYLRRRVGLEHRLLLDVESPLYFLCDSPDGRTMAAAGKDAIVRLFDPETGVVSREIQTGQIEVNGLAYSPDGTEIATAGDDGTIRFWDLESGKERLAFKAHPGKAFQLAYSRDGLRIASCGNNPIIRVFDTRSGEALPLLKGHTNDVQSLVMDRDGNTLASTSSDHTTRLWDMATGEEIALFDSTQRLGPAVLSSSRQLLITGTDEGLLESWNLRTRTRLGWGRHLDRMGSLALHPDGKLLAASDAGGSIHLWELGENNNFVPGSVVSWQAHRGAAMALAWSGDGSKLISTGNDGRVMTWSLAAARNSGPRHFPVSGVDFAPVPKTTWIVTDRKQLELWDWTTGNSLGALNRAEIGALSCSPDGRFVAGATKGGGLHLYPVPIAADAKGVAPSVADWDPPGRLDRIRFSPDGRLLAATCWSPGDELRAADDSVWLLSLPRFERIERIPLPHINQVAFAPDSRHIALHTIAGIALWDIEKNELQWEVPQIDVAEFVFSPDGTLLFSRCDGRNVMVRNRSDGSPRSQLTGHRSQITSLALSPDGRTLATAAENGVIMLTHVPTGRELFDIYHAGINCVKLAFSEDGRHLFGMTHPQLPGSPYEILVFDAEVAPY